MGVPPNLRELFGATWAATEAAAVAYLCLSAGPWPPERALGCIGELWSWARGASYAGEILDADLIVIRPHYRRQRVYLSGKPKSHAFGALAGYVDLILGEIDRVLAPYLDAARAKMPIGHPLPRETRPAVAEAYLAKLCEHFGGLELPWPGGLLLEAEEEIKLLARYEWEGNKVVYPARLGRGIWTAALGADGPDQPELEADTALIVSAEAGLEMQSIAQQPDDVPAGDGEPEWNGLKIVAGGFVYRSQPKKRLSAKPLGVLRAALQARNHIIRAASVLATVWRGRPEATERNVGDAVGKVRRALRDVLSAENVECEDDPFPCISESPEPVAWELKLPLLGA